MTEAFARLVRIEFALNFMAERAAITTVHEDGNGLD